MRDLILRDPVFAGECVANPPDAVMAELIRGLESDARSDTEAMLRQALRKRRQRAALCIALADLSGPWSLDRVTEALTGFAQAALQATVEWLLRDGVRSGKTRKSDGASASEGSGYAVLAMGKFGARELNYSSDIDLIVLYDYASLRMADGIEPATFFVRLTKRLVGILQDITEDGYVYRVDLRLRPDPRATQIAISMDAAATYYESMGQNWERAAMIKARPVAGDLALGEEFLRPPRSLCLAQVSRFCRHRRCAITQAPDTRGEGSWRDRRPGS